MSTLTNPRFYILFIILLSLFFLSGCTTEIDINQAIGKGTIEVLNIHNNREVHTGFMIGTASVDSGVGGVEVSLDGGSWQTAVGTTNWKYQFPTGANTWRDGSSHTIAVRAVNNVGTAIAITTLSVKKGANNDLNGDGYVDLVVCAHNYNSGQGRVYLFHSSGTTGVTNTEATNATVMITGEVGSRVGTSVALGDINGDGYADLVVGAYLYNSSQGRAYVFHSSGTGGVTNSSAVTASATITGEAGSAFGSSIVLGDINGDGYDDLVVGARYYNSNQGRVYIFHAVGSEGITIASATLASTIITGEASSFLGHSVALGDVNGDGNKDLVVGAYKYNSDQGRVYIFNGTGFGGISITSATLASTIITGEVGSRFGCAIDLGDVNGDGYADLVVGAFTYNLSQGRTYIFHSSGTGGLINAEATNATTLITGVAGTGMFGWAITLGDVNGDGYADLVIGASRYNSNQGRVYIFHSTGIAGVTSTEVTVANFVITGDVVGELFGFVIDMGDVNGDGYADLLVSSYYYNSNQGRVYVYESDDFGSLTNMAASSASTIITGEAASLFGSSATFGNAGGYY